MQYSDDIDEAVGMVLGLNGCDWPDWLIRYHLEIPFSCEQIVCQRDESRKLTAFMLWAFVGDDVHRELRTGAVKVLHLSEWTEGLNLWVKIFSPGSGLMPVGFRHELRRLAERFGTFHLSAGGVDGTGVVEGRWTGELRFRNVLSPAT
jgi:hemolysin-activating ACP:hemolysin acyltransferase